MSVAEVEAPRRLFGEITLASMKGNAELARLVMRIVRDACSRARGGLTVETVAAGIHDGRFRLWGVMAQEDASLLAVAVAEIKDHVFTLHVLGPKFRDFVEFLPVLEKLARGLHCARMEFLGTLAFERELKPLGWFVREARFERALDV